MMAARELEQNGERKWRRDGGRCGCGRGGRDARGAIKEEVSFSGLEGKMEKEGGNLLR